MKVGLSSLVQNLGPPESDGAQVCADLELALRAEELGFDSLWAVEHHFSGYSIQPNPLLWLTYLAARTEFIQLGSMVIVLPWHNPARVIGEISMFDHLCSGRSLVGIGRGLGRLEFGGLNVSMENSRATFDESAELLLQAMDSGVMEYNGAAVNQECRQLRPSPRSSLRGRVYAAAVSPESADVVARLGAGLIINPQKPWTHIAGDLATYRTAYATYREGPPPRPIVSCQVYCHEDAATAERVARQEMTAYYNAVMAHYEMAGDHFADTKGYEYYDKLSSQLRTRDESDVTDFYLQLQVFGTPAQCVEKIRYISEVTGTDHFVGVFSYAGLSQEAAHASAMLFAREAMPAIKDLDPSAVPGGVREEERALYPSSG